MGVRVSEIEVSERRHSCQINFDSGHCGPRKPCSHQLWISALNGKLNAFPDSLFALILPMALRVGGEFKFEARITESLFKNLEAIIKELRIFDQTFREINLLSGAPQRDIDASADTTSSFFSGGLDSIYTARHHKSEVLVSVHGFDISHENDYLWGLAFEKINIFADRYGVQVIALKTNVREISNQFLGWGAVYHGAALGAIALGLPSNIGSTIIPSTSALLASKPGILGTGDSLCRLFSNMGRSTITDVEKSRLSKIYEMRCEVEVSELRVCWENKGGQIQCGTCFKCVLTTIELIYADVGIFPEGLSKNLSAGTILKLRPSVSQAYFLIEDYRTSKELNITSNVAFPLRLAIFWICTLSLCRGFIKKKLRPFLSPFR